MPDLIPFPGLRYAATSDISRLAAPPYDVIDEVERERLEALDPRNAVRLILPRDHADADRYAVAATILANWQRDGILRRDPRPTFTIVRMHFRGPDARPRSTLGLVGALRLPVDDEGSDILPHERTLPRAKSDRLALLEATRANLDPIWGLSLAGGLSDLLATDRPPDALCHAEDCAHEAWVLDDADRIHAIRETVGRSPLVLADGHHRFETAQRYHAERGPGDRGAAAVMALVVELTDDQLCIQPIHRLLRIPVALDLRRELVDRFEVLDVGPNEAATVGRVVERAVTEAAIVLVDRQGLALLRPRADVRTVVHAEWPPQVADTDAAVVEAVVRPRLEGAEWEYRAGADTVAGLVRDGTADAALLLRPVDVATTRAVAEAGTRMPPKTTFFHPKPRTGFVFRTLDENGSTSELS